MSTKGNPNAANGIAYSTSEFRISVHLLEEFEGQGIQE